MNSEEFRVLLESAIAGEQCSIERLIQLYRPLINRSSHIKGKFDEDLRQHILLHIIKNISKFKI